MGANGTAIKAPRRLPMPMRREGAKSGSPRAQVVRGSLPISMPNDTSTRRCQAQAARSSASIAIGWAGRGCLRTPGSAIRTASLARWSSSCSLRLKAGRGGTERRSFQCARCGVHTRRSSGACPRGMCGDSRALLRCAALEHADSPRVRAGSVQLENGLRRLCSPIPRSPMPTPVRTTTVASWRGRKSRP